MSSHYLDSMNVKSSVPTSNIIVLNESTEYDGFTKNQIKAIYHLRGPALVIAGPGAGKTLIITERVKKLIGCDGIDPKTILVTTFTEKAANELKVRLAKTIGKKAELIYVSTIHSFCKSMLEKYFLYHDYGAEINVLDDESQKLLIELNKVKLGIAYWDGRQIRDVKKSFNFTKDICSLYDKLTQNNIDPTDLIDFLVKNRGMSEGDLEIINGYNRYLEMLKENKKVDFALLQTLLYKLATSNEDVLRHIQESFDFLLIDEYQDTSPIQDKIIRLIAGSKQNLFVVGDENQSIYGFRGASIKNFRNFLKNYPSAQTYFLNTNFRSTETIVNFSNKVFEKGVRKELESRRRKGEKIKIICGSDCDDSAKKAVELIKKMKDNGIIKSYGDVCLLFRSLKSHAKEYIKYLHKEQIPYITYGDGQFFERKEIRIIIYLISYVTQELYLDNKFANWKNWWKKDLFLDDFFGFSVETKTLIMDKRFELYKLSSEDDFKEIGFTNYEDIRKLLRLNKLKYDIVKEKDAFGEIKFGNNSLLIIFYKILNYTGYFEKVMSNVSIENKEILYNLAKLSNIIGKYQETREKEDIKNFLWYVYHSSADIDQEKLENENTVKLMTVHKAKGMEFPVVFLCCMTEGRFPLLFKHRELITIPKKFLDKNESEDEKEEFYQEERRLFYVGLTRAQDNLIFTASDKVRTEPVKKSRFLDIIPKEFVIDSEMRISTEKRYQIHKEVTSLNYSAINTFINCPLRYALVYNYGFKTPASFAQNLGSFVHNTLQRINEAIQKNKEILPVDMKKIVDSYWIGLPISREQNKNLKEKITKEFIMYYLTARENFKEILAIEESFSHIDDNMIIKGKVDLIVKDNDNNVCLIDFKAREQKGIEETNVEKQLQMYNYCLDSRYKIDKLIAYTFRDNKKTEFPINKTFIRSFLEEISLKISKENFHKQKNGTCNDCIFDFYCWSEN